MATLLFMTVVEATWARSDLLHRQHQHQTNNLSVFQPFAPAVRDIPTATNPPTHAVTKKKKTTLSSKAIVEAIPPSNRQKATFVSLLAVLSGAANVVCFQRFQFFTTMMTGNLIRCATAFAELRFTDAAFYAGMMWSYLAGVAIFRLVDLHNQKQQLRPTTRAVIPATLLTFFLSDVVSVTKYKTAAQPLLLAAGFGIVNAAGIDATATVTNAATVHITKIGLGLVDGVYLGARRKGTRTGMRFIGSFFISVLLTTVLYQWIVVEQPWLVSQMPPIGSTFGVFYTLLFGWYSRSSSSSKGTFLSKKALPIKQSKRKMVQDLFRG
jgi:uncharacterized membrane protein YoaK (UPF0700 family)